MLNYLSKVNRRRLFLRAERSANEEARKAQLDLTEAERSDIESVLKKFAPKACGHELRRLGPDFDGGYLLPDDMIGIEALYSPGVSDTLGFDLEIAKMGIPCFLADGTVEQPAEMHTAMHFEKMMIGSGPDELFMSLESWVSRTAPSNGDLMLQMDIEGSEYDVLLDTPHSLLKRFRIIVIEIHWINKYLLSDARSQLNRMLDRLLESHTICHLHPNNVCPPVDILGRSVPPLLELTLLRNDRLGSDAREEGTYPHPLDATNDPNAPFRDFPPFWHTP